MNPGRTKTLNPRAYFLACVAVSLGALVVVAVFNVVVDPFRIFPKFHAPGFDHLRDSVFSRVARAELARRGDWDMIILGTSRPKLGMPAVHPAFATNRVCNLSLDAGRMTEAETILEYTRARNPLRRVLLCLDLALVREGGAGPNSEDFRESRFNRDVSRFQYYCKNLIGAGATDSAIKFTLRRARHDEPPALQRDGFHVRSLEKGARQRAVFARTLRSLAYTYSQLRESPEEMEALRRAIRLCRQGGIELTLAINPVHSLDLELMRSAGAWDELEQWKRRLVKIVAQEGGSAVAVWDFTGYTGPTAEPVPAEGDAETRMKYYFENSHYTAAMGALMLDRMYGGSTNLFGAKIDAANIESRLEQIRRDRDSYAAQNAADVAWAREIARKALAARKQTTEISE